MTKFEEHEVVRTKVAIGDVAAGHIGTIVIVFSDTDYEVEFTEGLESYGTFTMKADQLSPLDPEELEALSPS